MISKSIKRTLRKELWNREETGYKFTARIYLLNLQRWPTPGQDFCSLHGLKWWESDDAEAAFPGIFKLSGLPSLRERMQGTDHTVFLEYRGKHPWGNWVCLHLGSYNDWETKITETFAFAPLILILGTDREMGQFFFFCWSGALICEAEHLFSGSEWLKKSSTVLFLCDGLEYRSSSLL